MFIIKRISALVAFFNSSHITRVDHKYSDSAPKLVAVFLSKLLTYFMSELLGGVVLIIYNKNKNNASNINSVS